ERTPVRSEDRFSPIPVGGPRRRGTVNPQLCLTDLLTRLVNGWPNSQIDELMPWHWAPAKNG
ncbi:MAG: transposase domain-containing protein, partial [Paracraurococcus sp.]